jgi:hypothetical protein
MARITEDKQNTAEGRTLSKKAATKAAEADADASQAIADEIAEQGFRGVKVDPRPNEDYTVAGVTGDDPPQTNEGTRAVQVDVRELGAR